MKVKLLQLKKLKKINDKKKDILKVRAAKMLRFNLKFFNKLNTLKKTEKREATKVAIKAIAKGKLFAFFSFSGVIFNFPSFFTFF